jgi:tRNA uridine 5-carboxymethylaminomethyl modification enzyme
VQERALKSVPGLENCRILQIGYAVEYDAILATQLHPTYECRAWPGLYFAGQVNGTSGYEEAAAQGLMAGINAALKIKEKSPFILSRADSYIGVMTDDLVNVEYEEPYRLFTSRAEYRLFLRQDNAECRLLNKAGRLGLIKKGDLEKTAAILEGRAALTARLAKAKVSPGRINRLLKAEGKGPVKQAQRALDLLRRPDISLPRLLNVLGWTTDLSSRDILAIESEVLYAGFYERQKREIDRIQKLSNLRIPADFNYEKAVSMCVEAREKLKKARPLTVHLASRVPGVKPVDLSGLIFHLNRSHPSGRSNTPSA